MPGVCGWEEEYVCIIHTYSTTIKFYTKHCSFAHLEWYNLLCVGVYSPVLAQQELHYRLREFDRLKPD